MRVEALEAEAYSYLVRSVARLQGMRPRRFRVALLCAQGKDEQRIKGVLNDGLVTFTLKAVEPLGAGYMKATKRTATPIE